MCLIIIMSFRNMETRNRNRIIYYCINLDLQEKYIHTGSLGGINIIISESNDRHELCDKSTLTHWSNVTAHVQLYRQTHIISCEAPVVPTDSDPYHQNPEPTDSVKGATNRTGKTDQFYRFRHGKGAIDHDDLSGRWIIIDRILDYSHALWYLTGSEKNTVEHCHWGMEAMGIYAHCGERPITFSPTMTK